MSPGPSFRRLTILAPNHFGPEADGLAEQCLEPLRDGTQAERGIGLTAGPAQMRGDDHRAALLASRADGGERRPEAAVLGYAPILQRHVQIGPQQEPAAAQVEVSKGQLAGFRRHGGAKHTFRGPGSLWTKWCERRERSVPPVGVRRPADKAREGGIPSVLPTETQR